MTLAAQVSFASLVHQNMPTGDPGETTMAVALAESLANYFSKSGEEVAREHIAFGACRAISERGAVANRYQYAREVALRVAAGVTEDALEADSEARFAQARQPVALPDPTAPPSSTTAPELDVVANALEEALARKPDVLLSPTQGRPETARRMIVDAALLLYRCAGEGAAHQIVRNGQPHYVAARHDDLPWLAREAMDWYNLVLAASSARAHGRRPDEIPHPYRHLFSRLLAYRVQQGTIPPPPEKRTPNRRESESGLSWS